MKQIWSVESCPEITSAENAKSATTEGVSGNSSARTDKDSSGFVGSASKNSDTRGK